jgi:hypothetical protein
LRRACAAPAGREIQKHGVSGFEVLVHQTRCVVEEGGVGGKGQGGGMGGRRRADRGKALASAPKDR